MKMPKGFFVPFLLFNANLFSVMPNLVQTLLWPFVWGSLRIFGKLKIVGQQKINTQKGGAIFAVNHTSKLDPLIIPATLGPHSPMMPMFYVSRERDFYEVKGIKKYFFGGFAFKMSGAWPVLVKEEKYESKLAHHINILNKGKSVCIFPEGGINKGKMLLMKWQLGAAFLLWRTGSPVIPVAIYGHKGLTTKEFFSLKRKIVVSFGEPITREELFGEQDDDNPPTREELIAATEVIKSRVRELLIGCGADDSIEDPGLASEF